MNTFAKFLTTASIAAILPLSAMAATEVNDSGPKVDAQSVATTDSTSVAINPEVGGAEPQTTSAGTRVTGKDAEQVASDPLLAPEMITVQEADFDSALAGATLIDSPLSGKTVVSSDDMAVGSVANVYRKSNGDLLAEVTLSDALKVNAHRALLPVSAVDADGDLIMKGDFNAIQNTFTAESGEVAID